MTQRKSIFINDKGIHQEMDDSDSLAIGGLGMGGSISMNNNKISSLDNATENGDVIAQGQSGVQLGSLTLTNDLDLNSNKISGVLSAVNATDAINMSQLNAIFSSFDFKESVRAATSISIGNLTNVSVTDFNGQGVDLVENDRVLVKDGASVDGIESANDIRNGIYVVGAVSGGFAPLTRSEDANEDEEVTACLFTIVTEGLFEKSLFFLSVPDPITLGTSSLIFEKFETLLDLIAGNGISKSNNTIDINVGEGLAIDADQLIIDLSATSGLEFNGDDLQIKTALAGALEKISSGLQVKIDKDLQSDTNGISVVGLPEMFLIDDESVGINVSATNLNILTDGSNADALHIHSAGPATEVPLIKNTIQIDEQIAIVDPVYLTSTGNRVGKADASDEDKVKVIGVSEDAQSVIGGDIDIITVGKMSNVLIGATPGAVYFLQPGGGIAPFLPGTAGGFIVRIGVATSATDLFVNIMEYGQKDIDTIGYNSDEWGSQIWGS